MVASNEQSSSANAPCEPIQGIVGQELESFSHSYPRVLLSTKGPKINSNLAQNRQALDFMSQTEYTISDKHITLLYLVYGLESWSVLEIESHVCHITFLTVFTKAMYRELDTLSSSYAFGLASSYAFGLVKMVYSYSLLTKST